MSISDKSLTYHNMYIYKFLSSTCKIIMIIYIITKYMDSHFMYMVHNKFLKQKTPPNCKEIYFLIKKTENSKRF